VCVRSGQVVRLRLERRASLLSQQRPAPSLRRPLLEFDALRRIEPTTVDQRTDRIRPVVFERGDGGRAISGADISRGAGCVGAFRDPGREWAHGGASDDRGDFGQGRCFNGRIAEDHVAEQAQAGDRGCNAGRVRCRRRRRQFTPAPGRTASREKRTAAGAEALCCCRPRVLLGLGAGRTDDSLPAIPGICRSQSEKRITFSRAQYRASRGPTTRQSVGGAGHIDRWVSD
jgi:hypothetical protein